MSKDFPNRQSIRLRGYDYAQNGYYFVTICVHQREPLFGEIVGARSPRPSMILNNAGKIVDHFWQTIPGKFLTVGLDEYQIMPNHLHGIVIVGARSPRPIFQNIHPNNNIQIDGQGDPAPTLGKILAYFKYQSAKQIRLGEQQNQPQKWIYIKKIWQRNYYEHIIRSEKEYWAIKQYIRNNPKNWDKDTENPIC